MASRVVRCFWVALFSAALFLMTTAIALAQSLGTSTPTVYKISIKVEFKFLKDLNGNTTADTGVFQAALDETTSDIAAVSQNSTVATVASKTIPAGEYDVAKLILGCTWTMKGSVVCPAAFCGVDTTYYTAKNADKLSTDVNALDENDYSLTGVACNDTPVVGKHTADSSGDPNFQSFKTGGQVNFSFDLADKLELIGPVASPSFRPGGFSISISSGAVP